MCIRDSILMSTLPLNDEASDSDRQQLEATLKIQRDAYFSQPVPSLDERRADLKKLQTFIRDQREAIVQAINLDYGNRSRHETLFTEIFTVIDAVEHGLKH